MFGDRKSVARALALVGGLGVLVSCAAVEPVSPVDPTLSAYVLTRSDPEALSLVREGDDVVATARPGNITSGIRAVFTDADAPVLVDSETCATWRSVTGSDLHQEGVAFRVQAADGHVRAVSITKNVWGEGYYVFNVHTWDTRATPAGVLRGQADLEATFATGPKTVKTFPWRMCARAVGNRVSFVVWPLAERRPVWGDPRYGSTVTVPDEYVQPGRTGTYIGHVLPESSVRFSDIVSGPVGIGDQPPSATAMTLRSTSTTTVAAAPAT